MLRALFAADTATFESQLRLQESEVAGSPVAQSAFAVGEALGRALGTAIAVLARSDNFDAVWTGTVPNGAILGQSNRRPA